MRSALQFNTIFCLHTGRRICLHIKCLILWVKIRSAEFKCKIYYSVSVFKKHPVWLVMDVGTCSFN